LGLASLAVAALLLAGCATAVTIDGRPTQRVPNSAEHAEAAPSAAQPRDEPAGRQGMFERIRRRDAVVIRPDEQPVRGSAFGPLLNVDPPTAGLPGLR
jgi:hypothetical protein